MSKKIKTLVQKDIGTRFTGLDGCVVVSPRGMSGNKNNKLRKKLNEQGMKMLVVKNSLARRAAESTRLKGFDKLLSGPSAVIYGEKVEVSAIARLIVDLKKEDEKLELRGVFFDGTAFEGDKGVEEVSKFPTRVEAIGQLLSALLGPAGAVAGALNQGGMLAGLVAGIEEKRKSEGQSVGEAASA